MIMKNSRKGMTSYISWILIFAFMVSISALMYNLLIDQVEVQTEQMEERVDTNICEDSGITVNQYCQDEYSLIMNITNTKTQTIEGLRISLFDIYDEPFQTSLNETIKSGEKTTINILKHGTLIQAEITPRIKNQDRELYCTSSKAVINSIEIC